MKSCSPAFSARPEAAEQVLGQRLDVAGPLAQARQADLERVDAVHQVFAEIAGLDHLGQVAVRGADDAHIDLERVVVADAADFAAFQHAQQLGLHALGQLADFVEKNRAAVSHFEQADAMVVGAGERAFAMAEQLAFDQRLGQCAAVDRDERLLAAEALLMHGAGDQLLAGAGFAQDQHRRVRRRDLVDQPLDLLHSAAVADQLGLSFDPLELMPSAPGLCSAIRAARRRAVSSALRSTSLQGLVR